MLEVKNDLTEVDHDVPPPSVRRPTLRASYTWQSFSKMRHFMIDASRQAGKKNLICFHFDADVTHARRLMQRFKNLTGRSLSFTVFILCCFCKAVDEEKRMHAMRKGGRKLILFDDVDATVIIEKEVEGALQPVYYIVRRANCKSFFDIQREVRWAAKVRFEDMCSRLDRFFFTNVPRPLRDLTYWLHRRSPRLTKFFHGTTCITSVGMFGTGTVYMTPLIGSTSSLSVGTINTAFRPVSGRMKVREMLSLVLTLDHDIIDGAYATRFIMRLKALIDRGFALPAEDD